MKNNMCPRYEWIHVVFLSSVAMICVYDITFFQSSPIAY